MMKPLMSVLKRVPAELLQERLKTVHTLTENDLEMYEIAKDQVTGEHYLHYAYSHRNLSAPVTSDGMIEEVFHYLMPLENDDVLGMMFNGQPYEYPDHWHRAFLRNGPDSDYVWFDPSFVGEHEENEAYGREIIDKLRRFKEKGDFSEDSVRKLLEETLDEGKNK